MLTLTGELQNFTTAVHEFGGRQFMWVVTPMLWLMSDAYLKSGLSTEYHDSFGWMETKRLLGFVDNGEIRHPVGKLSREELAVPVILVTLDTPVGKRDYLVDGIHRIRDLHNMGVDSVETFTVPSSHEHLFRVSDREVPLVQSGDPTPLARKVEALKPLIEPSVVAMRDGLRARGNRIPDWPLPQTILERGVI